VINANLLEIKAKMLQTISVPWSPTKSIQFIAVVKYSERKLQRKLRKEGFAKDIFRPVKQNNLCTLVQQLKEIIQSSKKTKKSKHRYRNRLSPEEALAKSWRILVVDDNHNNLEYASMLINKLGFNCTLVSTGEEALKCIEATNYNMILLDIQMPNMNGYEVTQKIRKMEEKTKNHIVIVAMTANVESGERIHSQQCGMDDFLSKPLLLSDLKCMLEKYVSEEYRASCVEQVESDSYDENDPVDEKPQKRLSKHEKVPKRHQSPQYASTDTIITRRKKLLNQQQMKTANNSLAQKQMIELAAMLQKQQRGSAFLSVLMIVTVLISALCFMGSLYFLIGTKKGGIEV